MGITKVSFSLINGAPINVYDYGAIGDGLTDDTAALQAAIDAASGKQLWLGAGNFKITATLNLPQKIRVTGATNRGNDTRITAAFSGPALQFTNGSPTFLEMYLEHFQVFGNAPVYGAGNGIVIENGSSFNMHSCLVSGFGTDQLHIGTGSYGAIVRDCYVAETYGPGISNANIYCASEYCLFDKIESDDAAYSILLVAGSYGTVVTNSTLEGFSTAGISIENSATVDRSIVQGNKINDTRGGNGIVTDSNRTHIINNQVFMTTGLFGISLNNNSYGAVVTGNSIVGGSTGIYLQNSGQNIICENSVGVNSISVDVQGGVGFPTYQQVISNNVFSVANGGITLRHNQNSKTTYIGNVFRNSQTDAYIAPTIVAGTPVIISTIGTSAELSVISGAINFPANALVVSGGGGTGIVTAGVADSGGAGFRLLQIPN